MKTTILGLFLFCGTAGAQQPAPGAPAPAHGGKYYEEIMQAVKYLAVLVDRNAEIPAEKMDALAPEISSFTARVKAAIGEKILTEMARSEKEAEDKARSIDAEKTLQAFRAALQVYYTEEGGKYPRNPAVLVPRLMPAVPKVRLPEHAQTDKIIIIDSKRYEKDISKAVTDSGGWLYFASPESVNYGLLLLDCTHMGQDGSKFYEY